ARGWLEGVSRHINRLAVDHQQADLARRIEIEHQRMPQRARRMPRKYAERTACEEMPGNEAVPPAVERVLQRRVRIPGHVHRRVCRWLDGERTSFERDRAEGVCQTGCRFWRDEAVFAFGRRVVVRLI